MSGGRLPKLELVVEHLDRLRYESTGNGRPYQSISYGEGMYIAKGSQNSHVVSSCSSERFRRGAIRSVSEDAECRAMARRA